MSRVHKVKSVYLSSMFMFNESCSFHIIVNQNFYDSIKLPSKELDPFSEFPLEGAIC